MRQRPTRRASASATVTRAAKTLWQWAFVAALVVQLVVLYWPRAPAEPTGVIGIDKVIHALVFAVPVCAALLAGLRPRWVVLAFAMHAPLSEILQSTLLPHRAGGAADAVADLTGVALGWLAFVVWRRSRR